MQTCSARRCRSTPRSWIGAIWCRSARHPARVRRRWRTPCSCCSGAYGLAVLDFGAMVRVVPDGAQTGYLPELRRGSALPETPERLRPVFQLVELEAVRNVEVAGWLKTIMGNRVTVTEDTSRNAVLLSGTTDNVAAAIETHTPARPARDAWSHEPTHHAGVLVGTGLWPRRCSRYSRPKAMPLRRSIRRCRAAACVTRSRCCRCQSPIRCSCFRSATT